jgi:inner membrane protein
MPTPIGHSLAGYLIFTARNSHENQLKWTDMLVAVIIANMADLDIIPGILVGNANKFHHGITHSIGFAVIVGLLAGLLFFIIKRKNFLLYFSLFFFSYFSHVLLDYLAADTKAPFGEQLFWPISQIYVLSPIPIFSDVHKASDSSVFLQSLFNWHNFRTIVIECAILIPIIYLTKLAKNKLKLKKSITI